jgi:predicted enzyme related to lactoylglutathione lyase
VISRISVVYLYVADLDRSLAFYRDVLGLALERHPQDDHWAEVTFVNGTRFALHLASHRPPQAPATVEVSFEVADLEAALDRIRGAGVEPLTVTDEPWGSLATVADPDGYEIGLFAPRTGGYGSRVSAE